MESKINPFISNKGYVSIIGQLCTGREGNLYQPGGESYCSSFAPDESIYAWSSGFRKVVLVPWNRYKNCLISDCNTDARGNLISSGNISIDCGFQVSSLAFGAGTPEGDLIHLKKRYWTRFDFSDLILATGHKNGRIRIWDPYTGKLLLELTDHRYTVTCLSFSPNGSLQLASGSEDGTIKIWDLADDGNMFKTLGDLPRCAVKCLSWSPDSHLICSVGLKQKVYLWEMKEYKLKKRLIGHLNDVVSCSFSPDGAVVATASCDTRVILWSTETGECLIVLSHVNPPPGIIYMAGSNDYYVRGVSFSANGFQIASICSDGYLRFWDLTKAGEEPDSTLKCCEDDVMLSCSYTPSGGAVAVSYASGNVVFYLAPPKVPRLSHLSRVAFRRALGCNFGKCDLWIPQQLIRYLQYEKW